MATKTLVIVGATGEQGGSVIDAFLGQKGWKIRGVTRDPTSAKSQKLAQKGLEIVKGEANDKDSLIAAFRGATAIYAVTDFWNPFGASLTAEEVEALEVAQGRNIVDAASATPTLEHFVWSTLPSAAAASGGKILVPHFEGKATVDEYIKASPLKDKTTFFWVGYYAANFNLTPLQPTKLTQGGRTTYAILLPIAPNTIFPAIVDHSTAIGPLVSAVILQPQKTLGRYVWAKNGEKLTAKELFETWAEVVGVKDFKYIQVTDEAYETLYGKYGVELGLMLKFWEQHGWPIDGLEVVSPADLGVSGLKSLREYLQEGDWSAIL